MSVGTEIADAFGQAFDALRDIFGPSGSLKILSGSQAAYTTLATYTTGWSFRREEYDDLKNGVKYRKLIVSDPDGTRKTHLKAMTAIQVDSVIHKNPGKDPHLNFEGGVPTYTFKMQP